MIRELFFSQYSSEELKKIASPIGKDVYSPVLGTGEGVYCSVCKDPRVCPGHMGYIELKYPIINPLYVEDVRKIMDCVCPNCFKVPIKNFIVDNFYDAYPILSKTVTCEHCNEIMNKYDFDKSSIVFKLRQDDTVIFTPEKIKNMLSNINATDFGFKENAHPKNFILDLLPVVPNCIRSPDDTITKLYKKISELNSRTRMKGIDRLRLYIFDEYRTLLGIDRSSDDDAKSLRQRISGKSGTFRRFALGKRNKYCGRAVISPDPNLGVDEVGIPSSFAKHLPFFANPKTRIPIRNGDLLLLNRQPSLQRMSLMAFKVRLMDNSSTIRMNLAVCPAFNADFDGDEMNVFGATTYASRTEASEIMAVKKCIISPQNKNPTIYPIQDCVSGAYLMTADDVIVDEDTYCDCLMFVHRSIRPYTGKNLFSCLLPVDMDYVDGNIRIKEGRLESGRVNSSSLRNLIKTILTDYGEDIVVDFITNIQRVVNRWLLDRGLSVGYDDCTLGDDTLRDDLKSSLQIDADDDEMDVNLKLNNFRNVAQRTALSMVAKDNLLLQIIESGAKGSLTNLGQILSFVGQQNIRGERPKKLLGGTRALPYFEPRDASPEALGFCYNSYSQGLSPTEYFFHCQGAREGLINTGVNTSKTGYMQRKFGKSLEEVIVHYDGTVRNGDKIVQFCYGMDPLWDV